MVMAKVVAVISSGREESDAESIVNATLDGAMGLSTNVIKLYDIQKLRNVNGCKGCHMCKSSGICVISDDIADIINDIREADCVIFSTPVYFSGPSAQFKMLEDRMFSLIDANGNPAFRDKRAITVVTTSGPGDEAEKVEEFLRTDLHNLGFGIYRSMIYSDNGGRNPACDNDQLLLDAKKVGQGLQTLDLQ